MRHGMLIRKVRAPEGSALILTLIALFIVTALAAALFASLRQTVNRAARSEHEVLCMNLAEAGLNKAIAELRANPAAYGGETATPLGRGTFTVRVRPAGGPGTYAVESIGEMGEGPRARTTIHATIDVESGGQVRLLGWEESRS